MRKVLALVVSLVLTSTALAQEEAEIVNGYSLDAFALARHVTNEAGLVYGSSRNIDGALMGAYYIRLAQRHHQSVAEYIAEHYDRHTDEGRTSNRWILGLNRELTQPAEWRSCHDENGVIIRGPCDGDWSTDYGRGMGRERWRARLDEASAVLSGEIEVECPLRPIKWGGPEVDYHNLMDWLATGDYLIIAGPHLVDEPPNVRTPTQCHVGDNYRAANVWLARRPR